MNYQLLIYLLPIMIVAAVLLVMRRIRDQLEVSYLLIGLALIIIILLVYAVRLEIENNTWSTIMSKRYKI